MRRSLALRRPQLSFFHSIRFRITLWFVLILAMVLAAFSAFIYLAQRRDLEADAVGNMQEKLSRMQLYLRSAAWQSSNLSPTELPGNAAPLQNGDLMILSDARGGVLQTWGVTTSDPDALSGLLITAANQDRGPRVYERPVLVGSSRAQAANKEYLLTVTPIVRDDLFLGYLIVGSPSPLGEQLQRLVLSLLLGGLGMLVVAYLGGLWLADRAMRPVKTITQAARGISESDLSQRLHIAGRDELAELAGTFDAMLARLEAAFDRQRHFVADASHELRTPLTIINMEVDRVLSGPHTSGDYRDALKIVDAEGERMTRLVTDLMTLARMDAGQALLHTEDLDFSEIAAEAVDRMSLLALRHGVKVETGGALPALCVRGDRQYLLQMVSNLIENGVKYSGGGQTVRVATRAGAERTQAVAVLSVSDNGPGIPEDHIRHIFDRFYRADAARSRESDEDSLSASGSGLGLSIVAGIAQVHGGQVRVESQPHSGSTFEVTLPLLTHPA
jgi:heavy metal sensor kinase